MTWDDKDKDKDKNDPWNRNRNSDAPPDLDEILKKLQEKASKFFGGKGSNNSKKSKGVAMASVGLVALVIGSLWILSGIFIVGPAEEAVITRFGKYYSTVGPGLNWLPRFIDKNYIVDIQNVADFSYKSSMLTKDENIVLVELAVQYRINNPEEYLFRVDNPVGSLEQATASALRHVVGHTSLSDILTTGREVLRQNIRKQLELILVRYSTGLSILDVVMQPATPPEEVKEAFDDAIKAQEDEQRYRNQAEAYEKGVVPVAEGHAKRIFAEAKAYKEKRILFAKGDVEKFNALLPEYKKSPRVTRERLYIDTMESVLSKSSKILLDSKNSNNLMYLPIDKILAENGELPDVDNNSDIKSSKEFKFVPKINRTTSVSRDSNYSVKRDEERSRSGRSF